MKVQNSPFLFYFSQVLRIGIERKGERKEKRRDDKVHVLFSGYHSIDDNKPSPFLIVPSFPSVLDSSFQTVLTFWIRMTTAELYVTSIVP